LAALSAGNLADQWGDARAAWTVGWMVAWTVAPLAAHLVARKAEHLVATTAGHSAARMVASRDKMWAVPMAERLADQMAVQ
jgi:hypothetical protein